MARKERRARRTVLLVVEGYTDRAFVQHLKDLYHQRGCGFRIELKNAKGKGANNVIDKAHGERRQGGYDSITVLYDGDVALTAKSRKLRRNFHVLVAEPCLEGLLLEILGKRVAPTCAENKTQYEAHASGREFTEVFPKETLEGRRNTIPVLDALLRLMEKGNPS